MLRNLPLLAWTQGKILEAHVVFATRSTVSGPLWKSLWKTKKIQKIQKTGGRQWRFHVHKKIFVERFIKTKHIGLKEKLIVHKNLLSNAIMTSKLDDPTRQKNLKVQTTVWNDEPDKILVKIGKQGLGLHGRCHPF